MSKKVECSVEHIEMDFNGKEIPGVLVTCSLCDHSEEAGGRSHASIKRCLAQMRQNCPEGENNFYVEE